MSRFHPNSFDKKQNNPAGWVHSLLSLLVALTIPFAAVLTAGPVQAQALSPILVDVAGGAHEQIEVVLQADQAPCPAAWLPLPLRPNRCATRRI
ncbi:MAG: hypothetical protein R2932_52485 [Caldilineaceae bacterium]